MDVGVAHDAAQVAGSLAQRLSERDADILDGVMLVDMQIALGRDLDIHQRMARQLIEHVVEKADAGRNLAVAGAVDRKFDDNVGFFRRALDLSLARHILSLADPEQRGLASAIPLGYVVVARFSTRSSPLRGHKFSTSAATAHSKTPPRLRHSLVEDSLVTLA